ncbi:hypothetical protein M9H77_31468 [Catharanthus roseus]|uniref:Uncharacterized protein n=1 Tax=Catharanthus roseus TaxID=4058 RepID=A0ACC0A0J4_CATRO|nr:hypothetical protein M9H77_31468 [Catharanthus roseus]
MCGCPFKLKVEQLAISENWQLFVHDGKHNHAKGVYNHGHTQAARLMEEYQIQTEQFRKSHVPPHKIIQHPCQDEEGKEAGAKHGRRSSLFKCSMGLYVYLYFLMFFLLFQIYTPMEINIIFLLSIYLIGYRSLWMVCWERRTSPNRYMRWLGRRPRCTMVIIYPRSKWDRSTRDVRYTVTTLHTTG